MGSKHKEDVMQTETEGRHEVDGRRQCVHIGAPEPAVPAADLYETEDEFVLELDVPGHPVGDLHVDGLGHSVAIDVDATRRCGTLERNYHLRERDSRPAQRIVHLPSEADTSDLTAWFSNGVLAVHVPKRPPLRTFRVRGDATPC
jgi:HSP20 family protein